MKTARNLPAGNRLETPSVEVLTPREREILNLLALGHTNAEIGHRLAISERTVETHRKHLTVKLRLHRRADLVRFACDHPPAGTGTRRAGFQSCANCRTTWRSHGEFLFDPGVRFVGYHPPHAAYPPGCLRFEHQPCGTRLDLAPESFIELIGEPVLNDSCAVTRQRDHCLSSLSPRACPPKCVCTFVWRVSQIVKDWPKDKPLHAGERRGADGPALGRRQARGFPTT